MIKHIQTDITPESGTCFSTCIQSIMDLPLDSTPNFCAVGENWYMHFLKWLEDQNLAYARFDIDGDTIQGVLPLSTLCIIVVESPHTKGGFHTVVGKTFYDPQTDSVRLEVVHDPHPLAEEDYEYTLRQVEFITKMYREVPREGKSTPE